MKTWLITGATSGIGYETCVHLLQDGNQVIACSRKIEALAELKSQYPGSLHIYYMDLTCPESFSDLLSGIFSEFKNVDVVLNSAGYGLFGAVEELGVEQINALVQTNLLGSIFFLRACLPFLRGQGTGHLMQLSSESGEVSFPALAVYQASKWGIEGFCEALRQEIKCFGIDVTLVVPGRVETNFDRNIVKSESVLSAYQKSTVGNYRRLLAMGKFSNPGSVSKMAIAIIECANQVERPFRLILGSDAYKNIRKSLMQRLVELKGQKHFSASTDK